MAIMYVLVIRDINGLLLFLILL